MTIKDSIKKVFGAGDHQHGTETHHTEHHTTGAAQPTGTVGTETQQRTVRAPDPHVPAGTAAGHDVQTQRRHAETMPQPEMEGEVWPEVHGKYHEASKEARLTNQNAKLAEEELEKLRLAQSQAQDALARQRQLREEAERAHAQFGQFDGKKEEAARALEAARQREAQAAQLAQEAEAAKRLAMEKQRAAQGLGPQGQQAERELQATTAEIEANKRRAAELQQHQHTIEELEGQRLVAERDTGRYAQALAQEKHNLQALEAQLADAKRRIHDGEAQLNHMKQRELELTNKIKQLGGKESPTAALRDLEAHHQQLVQRATAAQAALEEARRLQQTRLQEARAAEQRYKDMLSRLDPANAEVQRAKQEAERLANEGRENERRAHELAQRHQGLLSEVEKHNTTVTTARTDAEKHMQLYRKYEAEAEAAHNRKHERWNEANELVGQMGQTETTKFSTMQEKIKEFGSKLLHHGDQPAGQTTTTTTQHTTGMPGQAAVHHTSTTQGEPGQAGQYTGATQGVPGQAGQYSSSTQGVPGQTAVHHTSITQGQTVPGKQGGILGMGGWPVTSEE